MNFLTIFVLILCWCLVDSIVSKAQKLSLDNPLRFYSLCDDFLQIAHFTSTIHTVRPHSTTTSTRSMPHGNGQFRNRGKGDDVSNMQTNHGFPEVSLYPPLSIVVLGARDPLHVGLGNILVFLPAVLQFAILSNRLVVIDDDSLLGHLCRSIVCGVPLISQLRHWLFFDHIPYQVPNENNKEIFSPSRYLHVLKQVHKLTLNDFDTIFSRNGLDKYVLLLNGRDLREMSFEKQSFHFHRPLITVSGLDSNFNDWWVSWKLRNENESLSNISLAVSSVQRCVASYSLCDIALLAKGDIDCVEQAMYRIMFLHKRSLISQPHMETKLPHFIGPLLRYNVAELIVNPHWMIQIQENYSTSRDLWPLHERAPVRQKGNKAITNLWLRETLRELDRRYTRLFSATAQHSNNHHALPVTHYYSNRISGVHNNNTANNRDLINDNWILSHVLTFPTVVLQSMFAPLNLSEMFSVGIHLRNQFDFFENEKSEESESAHEEIAQYYCDIALASERRVVFRSLLANILHHAKIWATFASNKQRCFSVFVAADTVTMKLLFREFLLVGDIHCGNQRDVYVEETDKMRKELFDVLENAHSCCQYHSVNKISIFSTFNGSHYNDNNSNFNKYYLVKSILKNHVEKHRKLIEENINIHSIANPQKQCALSNNAVRDNLLAVSLVDPGIFTAMSAYHVKAAEYVTGICNNIVKCDNTHTNKGFQWPLWDWVSLSRSKHMLTWRRRHSKSQSTFSASAHTLSLTICRYRSIDHTNRFYGVHKSRINNSSNANLIDNKTSAMNSYLINSTINNHVLLNDNSATSCDSQSAEHLVRGRFQSVEDNLITQPLFSIARDKYHLV